jgi:hypothetical protein
MSPLEDAIQEIEQLTRKNYTVEQIHCAALMVIGNHLNHIGGCMDTLLEYADNATDN